MPEGSTSRPRRHPRYSVQGTAPRTGRATGDPPGAAVLLQPDPVGGLTLITAGPRGACLDRAGLAQLVRATGWSLRVVDGQDAPASGNVAARPPDGQPPRSWGLVPIMDAPLHDVWCGWMWQVLDPRLPTPTAFCSGCGLYVANPTSGRVVA